MPKTIVSADLSCYGNLISSGAWGGVKLVDILNQAGIDPSVATVDFTAQDGYSVSIPINTAMRTDIIIAYDLDGAPLTEVLRLVVPEANGNVWIAKITSISMSISPVDQVQSGTSGQSIIDQYQAIINTTTPAPQQLQHRVEIQPIIPSNETTIEPATNPTIVTIPQSEQKSGVQENSVFSFEFIWVLLGVVVVASFVFYCRKKN
jgi:DMSO/TMAO reductase YedYZ molybdopterin-dependent catalytic subunit